MDIEKVLQKRETLLVTMIIQRINSPKRPVSSRAENHNFQGYAQITKQYLFMKSEKKSGINVT